MEPTSQQSRENRTRLGPEALRLIEEMCGPGPVNGTRLDAAILRLRAQGGNVTRQELAGVRAELEQIRRAVDVLGVSALIKHQPFDWS